MRAVKVNRGRGEADGLGSGMAAVGVIVMGAPASWSSGITETEPPHPSTAIGSVRTSHRMPAGVVIKLRAIAAAA